jgi:hypothetical protein
MSGKRIAKIYVFLIPLSTIYKSENPLSTYHHPGKDNADIQTKTHMQTEVSTGDNFSLKAGNHSFMQVKL